MTRTRSDARRDYRQFPAAYTQLLEAFETGGKAVRLGPMPLKAAKSAKRDFYRFKGFLMRAVDDAQDDYARELMTVFNRASVRLEGADDDAYMIVDHNPLVQAVERLGLTVEELRPRYVTPDAAAVAHNGSERSAVDSSSPETRTEELHRTSIYSTGDKPIPLPANPRYWEDDKEPLL